MKTALKQQQQKAQPRALKDPRPAKIRAAALAEFNARLWAAVREGFHQEPFLSVSDWAAQNRFLTGAESGRYNPLRCPYQRAIQDCFNDPEVREITWQSAERVGKSTVGSNILGFVIDREPTDLLWVMPSREGMADFLKDELEPMIRANPILANKIGLGKQPRQLGKTNNTRRKSFLGGTATFVGGASASPLAFRTVRIVLLDEVDKLRVLPGEGDADALASKRVSTYGTDFKILRFSKPTLEGSSRIHRHFLRGSQALYYIACPACNAFQELGWASLRFDDMHLRCTTSDCFFDQDSWQGSVGEWRETVPNPHHKSFQCSALISPLIRWETLVEEYRAAVHALEGGDPSLIQVFENSRLGKVYSGRVEKLESGELYGRREYFS
jgi:phage terminase large subunit GpA-like protein